MSIHCTHTHIYNHIYIYICYICVICVYIYIYISCQFEQNRGYLGQVAFELLDEQKRGALDHQQAKRPWIASGDHD